MKKKIETNECKFQCRDNGGSRRETTHESGVCYPCRAYMRRWMHEGPVRTLGRIAQIEVWGVRLRAVTPKRLKRSA